MDEGRGLEVDARVTKLRRSLRLTKGPKDGRKASRRRRRQGVKIAPLGTNSFQNLPNRAGDEPGRPSRISKRTVDRLERVVR